MKIEALFYAISAYVASFAAAVWNLAALAAMAPMQATFPDPGVAPENVFWPALAGAFFAALLTIRPAFKKGAEYSPAETAFKAFVMITGGFIVGFWFTQLFAPWVQAYLPFEASLGAVGNATAVGLGAAGEKVLQAVYTADIANWKRWLPGGK